MHFGQYNFTIASPGTSDRPKHSYWSVYKQKSLDKDNKFRHRHGSKVGVGERRPSFLRGRAKIFEILLHQKFVFLLHEKN